MIWKEAQIEEKHEGNGLYSQTRPLKQKIRVDQSVINLFPPVCFHKEMVISVFCESPREKNLCKWASNCGLEEMPYKKSMSHFPLTSQYTQQISTSNQNINILLDFKCPAHCLCLPSAKYFEWFKAKVQRKAPYCGLPTFFPTSTSIFHHREPSLHGVFLLQSNPYSASKWVMGNTNV